MKTHWLVNQLNSGSYGSASSKAMPAKLARPLIVGRVTASPTSWVKYCCLIGAEIAYVPGLWVKLVMHEKTQAYKGIEGPVEMGNVKTRYIDLREVNESRGNSSRVTAFPTTVTRGDSRVDGSGVISYTLMWVLVWYHLRREVVDLPSPTAPKSLTFRKIWYEESPNGAVPCRWIWWS